ncbi:MAG: hypothetical protein FWF24_01015 [Alphaproteobacteria bacterium]|nr:hypothetical protein [Alphaproteobacteria bacterium]
MPVSSSVSDYAIVILHGAAAHDFLTPFNNEIARAAVKFGCNPIFVDLRDTNLALRQLDQALQTYKAYHILFAVTFQGLGIDFGDLAEHGNIWQAYKIPVLNLLAGHPSYNLDRHSHPAQAIMPLYNSRDFLTFHTNYIKHQGRKGYLPWGVFTHGTNPKPRHFEKGVQPLILCPKNTHDPEDLQRAWKVLPDLIQKIIHDALDDYWSLAASGPVETSVLRSADANGIELRHDVALFSFFLTQLDDYTKRVKSTRLIKELLPYPVTIHTNKVDHLDIEKARAMILPAVNSTELVPLYQKALAVVSMNSNVTDAPHERVLSALGAGALPITDANDWLHQTCPDLLPYTYNFKDASLGAAIEAVLDNPEKASAVAWEVCLEQRTKRTFERAMLEAFEMGLMHRYFTFNFVPPQGFYYKPSL